jgi:holo-[acyl-carrier protein] synthase
MILGLGTDLVDVAELRRRLERTPEIREQVYDDSELVWCEERRPPWPWLAERFAAKEAVMKALGTGWARGVTFRDVVVQMEPAVSTGGRETPRVRLTGEAAALLRALGGEVKVSLSHDGNYAIAMAVVVGGAGASRG